MWSIFGTIFILHWAALVIPGQNVLVISHTAASEGRRTASYAALGITAGAAILSTASLLGINALFNAFPAARFGIQIASSLYLLYVAARIWRTPPPSGSGDLHLSDASAFRLGLFTNLSNPKSSLFFISIFAAALPADPTAVILALSVTLVVFNALCWHLLVAIVFSHRIVKRSYARQRETLTKWSGAVMGIIGLSLLVSSLLEAGK